MEMLSQSFSVSFNYNVYFTKGLFQQDNNCLKDFLTQQSEEFNRRKILFVADNGLHQYYPKLEAAITAYLENCDNIYLAAVLFIPGGEAAKNNAEVVNYIAEAVNNYNIDRHSYLAAIGGGSVLDAAGYVAAVAHRGIRHIRIPTTVLSQNDSGVGVKNGINFFGKKNFLGTFAPPAAVFNDFSFLQTLDDRDWRSGIAEAVKVALIKDADFFDWLEKHADHLLERQADVMQQLVYRCAELHLEHIRGGDPFESGSSRPLDFGHWSAHKLEQLSDYQLRHGEAVAIGIAIDSIYSALMDMISEKEMLRIINLLKGLAFTLYVPELETAEIFDGLDEFREHLGGRLTIMLLEKIGNGINVHEMQHDKIKEAIAKLKNLSLF